MSGYFAKKKITFGKERVNLLLLFEFVFDRKISILADFRLISLDGVTYSLN